MAERSFSKPFCVRLLLPIRVLHVQRGVKQRNVRDGYEQVGPKTEMVVGKLKSASSKRDVPLNDTAIQAIKEMREEIYLGEDFPLIPDITGNFLKPERFRRRYYRLLDGAGVEHRGLHSLRPLLAGGGHLLYALRTFSPTRGNLPSQPTL